MFKALDNLSVQIGSASVALSMATGKELGMEYYRVWRAHIDIVANDPPGGHFQGVTTVAVKSDEEPYGVVSVKHGHIFWLKIDGKWIDSVDSSGNIGEESFILERINQAEYESDLAFELWPKVRVQYRPIRKWAKANRGILEKWNAILACITSTGCFQVLSNAAEHARETGDTWNTWMIIGTIMAFHGAVSVVRIVMDLTRVGK